MLNPADKIHFWASIMQDHTDFILMNLSSKEAEFINSALYYKNEFAKIENESKQGMTGDILERVNSILLSFIDFKRLLIQKLLRCDIQFNLPPTFINHMINEAMEFHRDLQNMQARTQSDPLIENIMLHTIWLPDAAGHAAAIAANLDPVETLLIKEAKYFEETFNSLFIKSVELGKMLERTNLQDGSLQYLNQQADEQISSFIDFLDRIRKLRMRCKVLGTIDPLLPDHMIREEQYYLLNIRSMQNK
jgi:hypothetical protein